MVLGRRHNRNCGILLLLWRHSQAMQAVMHGLGQCWHPRTLSAPLVSRRSPGLVHALGLQSLLRASPSLTCKADQGVAISSPRWLA